jgi:hypothetical protein
MAACIEEKIINFRYELHKFDKPTFITLSSSFLFLYDMWSSWFCSLLFFFSTAIIYVEILTFSCYNYSFDLLCNLLFRYSDNL